MTTQAEQLAAPFDYIPTRSIGGGESAPYLTGEQVTTRLNSVLGILGWSFDVKEHGVNMEADEYWVLGQLRATIDGQPVVREQFGSQKVKRARQSGTPLDIGFDLKGATTDALKKCATLIGVGLYLTEKEAPENTSRQDPQATSPTDAYVCETCGKALEEIRFRDGTTWLPLQLASLGTRKHGRVLCMDHYRQANEARRRYEQGGGNGAF